MTQQIDQDTPLERFIAELFSELKLARESAQAKVVDATTEYRKAEARAQTIADVTDRIERVVHQVRKAANKTP